MDNSPVTAFRTVLFDLDGTLVDAFPTLHRAYAHVLPQLGLPAPTPADVRAAVGGGLENAMRRFVPAPLLAEALRRHTAYSAEILLEGTVLMPGAAELLSALHARGVVCAVLTNKHGEFARRLCAHLGLAPFLRGVFGAGDTPWLKPRPELTAHVLAQLGADAAGACLVGDSPFDVETARHGGFPAFVVTTGTHTAEQLRAAGATGVYDHLGELGRAVFNAPPAAPAQPPVVAP